MSMVDKVARALALADLDPETRAIVNLDAHMLHVQEHYDELARAAIEAMREPTANMISAGEASEYGDTYHYAAPRHVWPLMIDAALKP